MLLIELLKRKEESEDKIALADTLLDYLPHCDLNVQSKTYNILLKRKFDALDFIRSCNMILDVAYSSMQVEYDGSIKALNEVKLMMEVSQAKIESITKIMESGLCSLNIEQLLKDLDAQKVEFFKLKLTHDLALFDKDTDDLGQITSEDEDGKD